MHHPFHIEADSWRLSDHPHGIVFSQQTRHMMREGKTFAPTKLIATVHINGDGTTPSKVARLTNYYVLVYGSSIPNLYHPCTHQHNSSMPRQNKRITTPKAKKQQKLKCSPFLLMVLTMAIGAIFMGHNLKALNKAIHQGSNMVEEALALQQQQEQVDLDIAAEESKRILEKEPKAGRPHRPTSTTHQEKPQQRLSWNSIPHYLFHWLQCLSRLAILRPLFPRRQNPPRSYSSLVRHVQYARDPNRFGMQRRRRSNHDGSTQGTN